MQAIEIICKRQYIVNNINNHEVHAAATITKNSTNSNTGFAIAQSDKGNATNNNMPRNQDIFHAMGTINSLTSDILTGINKTTNKTETYILGGDWNFDVTNGKLQNFKLNVVMVPIDGKGLHFHSISKLNNVTAVIQPFNNSKYIFLRKDNFTGFKGLANITTNGKPMWKNVPVEVYIIGGNIVNIHINSEKTDNHFKSFPVYGIVTSIVKPIRIISVPGSNNQ
jgi:hypothetical protein